MYGSYFPFGESWRESPLIFTVLVMALVGCSSMSAEEMALDRTRVLGTWKYRTDQIGSLQHGTLRITMEGDRLVGHLQDSWRGSIRAKIDLHGTRMEMDLSQVRITGRLDHDQFRGTVRRPFWDASRSHSGRHSSGGSFMARRVSSESLVDAPAEVGCASLLRETSYACSPLQPQ